jgi:beta-galactosidase
LSANTQSVELFVNGKSAGVDSQPVSGFFFAFLDIEFEPGSLKAIGRNVGKVEAHEELTTAGPPAQIKLTPRVAPHGLQADWADFAMFDVEVLDAKGQRRPTDDDRVDFTMDGPGVWRGSYNSGKTDSTNNPYLNTELGINCVFVRSTLSAGTITPTASRAGLKPAQVKLVSKPVQLNDRVADYLPQNLAGPADK